MSSFFKLLVLVATLAGAYFVFVPNATIPDLSKIVPMPQRIDPATGKPLIACPTCKGSGRVKCAVRGCVNGKVECNGPCLRLTKGTWIKDAKLGHGPDELWMPIREKGGMRYFAKGHVGEVVEMRDGQAVLVGPCKMCNKTTLMPCKVCKGTAFVTCQVCEGRKEVPDMKAVPAKPAATPVLGRTVAADPKSPALPPPHPATEPVRLKDGTTMPGKIVSRDTDFVIIRNPDGTTRQVAIKNLALP